MLPCHIGAFYTNPNVNWVLTTVLEVHTPLCFLDAGHRESPWDLQQQQRTEIDSQFAESGHGSVVTRTCLPSRAWSPLLCLSLRCKAKHSPSKFLFPIFSHIFPPRSSLASSSLSFSWAGQFHLLEISSLLGFNLSIFHINPTAKWTLSFPLSFRATGWLLSCEASVCNHNRRGHRRHAASRASLHLFAPLFFPRSRSPAGKMGMERSERGGERPERYIYIKWSYTSARNF